MKKLTLLLFFFREWKGSYKYRKEKKENKCYEHVEDCEVRGGIKNVRKKSSA